MGRKSQIFHQKSTRSACVSSRHCRRARRFSRRIVMARPAPLVARSTATRHSRAESPDRPTRLTRDRWVPTLSREYRWGEEIANFSANLYGQITVRDSRKFATKVKNLLGKNEGGKFGRLRDLPSKFLCKKKLYGRFLDSRLRVQNLLKNLLSFLSTGLNNIYLNF